jgi:4,5-dihydroxyphthalate decarboxylase
MAIPDFDLALVRRPHTEPLPTVATDGYSLNVVFTEFEEVRQRFLGEGDWHAAEIPLGRYIALKAGGDDTLTAIPVFPWRSFRHGAIHVRNDGSVTRPADLEGRRVGVTDWHQTAGIVARGLLAREYGVRLDRIDWVSGGLDGPPRREVAAVSGPRGVSVRSVETPLGRLLETGEIDAIISADPPKGQADGATTPLLPDHEAAEQTWYAQTGIFPLMHVITVRRTALDRIPSLDELHRVFEVAKSASTASRDLKWRYGLAENRPALDRLLADSYAQGIGARQLEADELFGR